MINIVILGIILDFILGDPYNFPHPVKLMGRIISLEDRLFRKGGKNALIIKGFFVAFINMVGTFFIVELILTLTKGNKLLNNALSVYFIYTALAAKSLDTEASKVKEAIGQGLEKARHQLSFIVGRETKDLSKEDIIKATIETVAENTSDGIIAPLFYIMLFGPAGGLTYKMVNTMDSMLGYKNEDYLHFGRYPAIIDDVFNYIPARITGILMCLTGLMFKKNAFDIMLRDRYNHKSPNAGFPEAAVAGILGIQLGGSNYYNGKLVEKPTLGDKDKEVEEADIDRTIMIMYITEVLFLLLYNVIYIWLIK